MQHIPEIEEVMSMVSLLETLEGTEAENQMLAINIYLV